MTAMLASVRTLAEADIAWRAGVDILDLKEPTRGALGALPIATVQTITERFRGRLILSATLGELRGELREDLPGEPPLSLGQIQQAAQGLQAAGVDIIKLGLHAEQALPEELWAWLRGWAYNQPRLVLVWLLGKSLPPAPIPDELQSTGVYGVMLDTLDKETGSLHKRLPAARLDAFLGAARAAGLRAGLAGALMEADIAPLLALSPDYLGFRSALCQNGRNSELDFNRTRRIRALIPRAGQVLPEFASMLNPRASAR